MTKSTQKRTFDQIIEDSHMKYSGIAKELGVAPSTFWTMRKNPRKMTADQLIKLSEILDVSFTELFDAIKVDHEDEKND